MSGAHRRLLGWLYNRLADAQNRRSPLRFLLLLQTWLAETAYLWRHPK